MNTVTSHLPVQKPPPKDKMTAHDATLRRILDNRDAASLAKLRGVQPNDEVEWNRYKDSLFRHCCRHGTVDMVRVLLEVHSADIHLAQTANRTTPLMAAASSSVDHQESAAAIGAYLLSRGALPHVCDHMGTTALQMAASRGNMAFVQHLVAADPSSDHINARNRYGSSALALAARWNNLHIVQFLLDDCEADWRDHEQRHGPLLLRGSKVPQCLVSTVLDVKRMKEVFLRHFQRKGRIHWCFRTVVLRGMQQQSSLFHKLPKDSNIPSLISDFLGVPVDEEREDMKRAAECLIEQRKKLVT